MRVTAVCEKCGATAEVHRFSGALLRFSHVCNTTDLSYVIPPFEKGPIHVADVPRR
jgi:hypothetical protein